MKPKNHPFAFLFALLLSLSLACSSTSVLTTATPAFTETPASTATSAPSPTPIATNTLAPSPTPTPFVLRAKDGSPVITSAGNLKFSNQPYVHPGSLLSFYSLEGWLLDASDTMLVMSEPGTGVSFYVAVTNTGLALNDQSYTNFYDNMETPYKFYKNYTALDSTFDPTLRLYKMIKTYSLDGKDYLNFSQHQQFGTVIVSSGMMGETQYLSNTVNDANPYQVMYDSFLKTADINLDVARQTPLYQWTWQFTPEEAPVTITVPRAWKFGKTISPDEVRIYYYFTAPDSKTDVEMIVYPKMGIKNETDGYNLATSYMKKSRMGQFSFSEARELEPKGLYAFSWENSFRQSGITLYDTRIKGEFVVVTLSYYDEIFTDLIISIGNSYKLNP